jgi:hypothetical protein
VIAHRVEWAGAAVRVMCLQKGVIEWSTTYLDMSGWVKEEEDCDGGEKKRSNGGVVDG